MTNKKFFCKILASLHTGSRFIGSYYRNAFKTGIVKKKIVNSFNQWGFRTNNYDIDFIFKNRIFNLWEITRIKLYIGPCIGSSRISRTNQNFVYFFTLSKFPCKSMLPAA